MRSRAQGGISVKLSVIIAGRRRIISLEEAFLRALKEIAARRATSLLALIAGIDAGRKRGNLSSAIRLFVLDFYREQLDGGQRRAPIKVTLERSIYDLH
jgi:predicted DNA-binding ribbon-helix-helix protein